MDAADRRPFAARSFTSAGEINRFYKLGNVVGGGSFAKVRRAEHRLSSRPVAVKVMSRKNIIENNLEDKVLREVKIMQLLKNHPHVVHLYEVLETPDHVFLVMEFAERGELYEYLFERTRFGEDEARWYFQQLIAGVEYCHSNNVIHRDLKTENLLLDSRGHLKIADFGLSNTVRTGQFLRTSCGSTNYAAPEVLLGRAYEGAEVDVWSCGVILFALLCGFLPFDDESVPVLFSKIRTGMYTLPAYVTAGPRDLITRMLQVDKSRRITVNEITHHPWFQINLQRHITSPPPYRTHIDEEVVRQVEELGIDKTQLLQALESGATTAGSVTYFIMLGATKPISNGYGR